MDAGAVCLAVAAAFGLGWLWGRAFRDRKR
jgi:hypothetical protein